MTRIAVNVVYDDEAGQITFEVPNDAGNGDAVVTIAVPAERLAAVEDELRGMRERAAAVSVTGGAAAVRDAITGPAR